MALAAPEWGITLEHHNAYGAQQASCTTAKEEYFPTEPEKDCGVDPFTGSGTTFDRESGFNEYAIDASNEGTEEIEGKSEIVDRLPAGLVFGGKEESSEASGVGWTCTIEDPRTAVCNRFDPLAAGSSFPPVILHVHVEAGARTGTPPAGGVTNTATVAGGGAATKVASDLTTIVRVPFGIDTFTTSVTDPSGGPLTQAGAHPFVAATTFAFDYVPADDGTLKTAGGSPRNIETELPPGFVGNPQAAPQCSRAAFESGAEDGDAETPCPLNTAVGYVHFSYSQGEIVKGRPNLGLEDVVDPVYNVAPGPGYPAAFGFVGGKSYAHFTLNTRVRADGDYGVTISSPYTAIPPTLAVSLSFCSNGLAQGGSVFAPSFSCAPTRPDAAAFLTNPSRCVGSAPATTLRADSYQKPGEYATVTSYAGSGSASSAFAGAAATSAVPALGSSFVTGCGLVGFSPEIDLAPSTSQGGQPIGAGFRLELPQAPDAAPAAVVGQVLHCITGEWRNEPTAYSYQWIRNGAEVSGATTNAYTLSSEDAGAPLQCVARAGNAGDTATAVATPFLLPPAPALPLPGAPSIAAPSGTASTGKEITCKAGTWTGNPTFTYQWLTNGITIPAATGEKYKVQAGSVPSVLQCEVVATNASGTVVGISANRNTSPAPSPAPPVSTTAPGVAGVSAPIATSSLRSATVSLPEGMTANPAAADGLEACTNEQFGVGLTAEPAEPDTCPAASQVGTVKVVTPLLEKPLEGQVFVGQPECGVGGLCTSTDAEQGHLFRLFVQVRLPERGVVVKLAGKVSANTTTGRLEATFTEQPQLPFSELILTLKSGARAPLANPQACGTATTTTDLTPWSAPGLGGLSGTEPIEGTPDAAPSSSFTVDWDGKGGACPATLPFNPSFVAQSASSAAGEYSPLSVAFGRPQPAAEAEEHDEQNFTGITLNMPEGLLGKIAGVEQCVEAWANAGTCPSGSQIGTATVGAGAGSRPYYLTGHVYLTGPYKGAPFGLSIAVPAEAGPFRLAGNTGAGVEVVRAGIAVNPRTAALTVTSDPLPQIVDGVPLRLHDVRVDVTRPSFTLNPTSCGAQQIGANVTGEHVNSGEANDTASTSSPFGTTGCSRLQFAPTFSASTQGVAGFKANGASLTVDIAQKGGEANIAKVDVQLPRALPARLSTLKQSCTATQFATNPGGCPPAAHVGEASAVTPLLNSPLVGPAILVSHSGLELPDLELVLQGEGITLILDGETQIKNGVTFSRFDTVPDAPISEFHLSLPEQPNSVLSSQESAHGSLCGRTLVMPTTITGQNGKQVIQLTKVAVTGCKPTKPTVLTRAQKLAKALKTCMRKKGKKQRAACDAKARKQFGPKPKTSKHGKGRK
ncbi:MAG: hypothetical protein ACRDLF_02540 [Solirubrobacteraceae bacterium]